MTSKHKRLKYSIYVRWSHLPISVSHKQLIFLYDQTIFPPEISL